MNQRENSLPKLKGYLPEQPSHAYGAIGRCIYCGSVDGLSDEHIIPLGLGGRLVLPKASCPVCSRLTSKFERTCLRTMYGPLRLLYELPSRRSKDRPEKLNLKVKLSPEGEWEHVSVNQSRFPFLVTFPYLGMPRIFAGTEIDTSPGPVTNRLWIRGASPSYDFNQLLEELTKDLGAYSIMPESHAHAPEFSRLLAKIAYAFAVAELGADTFRSFVTTYITGSDLSHCLHYIGSRESDEPPANSLHELSFLNEVREGVVTVRIRLLCKLGTPTYYVVVGETIKGAS